MIQKRFLFLFIIFSFLFNDTLDSKAFKRINRRPYRHYEDLLLIVGISRELYFPKALGEIKTTYGDGGFLNYAVVNDLQLKKYKLVVKANGEGDGQTTDLWVYDDKGILMVVYHVTASKENIKRIYDQIKIELKGVEGLKIAVRDNGIVLDGEILLPSDIARINQVISAYPLVFHVQYDLSPVLFNVIAEKMEQEINNPNIKVEVINKRFVLKGIVYSEGEYEDVVSRAKLLLPQYYYVSSVKDPGGALRSGGGTLSSASTDFAQLPLIPLLKIEDKEKEAKKDIKITIHFVEIAKGFEKDFGFKWMPSLSTEGTKMQFDYSAGANATDTASGLTTTLTGIISNFIPKLNSSVNNKKGRVIQAVAITTMDEQEGTVSKTTSYPYTKQTGTGPATDFANVGININVRPTLEGKEERIRLGLGVGVDQIVSFDRRGGAPVTAKNEINTWVMLKSGETAAIAGIVQNSTNSAYGNDPGDDNVIINLSRSKNFRTNKTQFVVFLTPEILESASQGSEDIMKKFRVDTKWQTIHILYL